MMLSRSKVVKVLETDLGSAYKVACIDSEGYGWFPSGISILHKVEIDVKAVITRHDDGSVEGWDDYIHDFSFGQT